ncbi:MAG: hypothetical protein ACRD8U_13670 [Pyrinomonadaceae bacterium]
MQVIENARGLEHSSQALPTALDKKSEEEVAIKRWENEGGEILRTNTSPITTEAVIGRDCENSTECHEVSTVTR